MAKEAFDFDFAISFNEQIPEWAWNKAGLYRGRISVEAVEKLAGPARPPRSLADNFNDIVGAAKNLAGEKVKRAQGALSEPIIIDIDDIP
ncbi:hypothetical protein [uncultured Sphingomonas sp.]|uniref:hypothetical protein n=1 Tax=uncultured Sphingomonas sp. TaxID=158754 RepID=UPI0025D77BCE|nr:hypothetical protein [uncultured Sphingomonas sp.]